MSLLLKNVKRQFVGPDGSVVPIIDIPDMSIGDGEQVALIGTSGSGKTTLLHLIAGILKADSGSITFDFSGAVEAPRSDGSVVDYRSVKQNATDITRLSEARRDVFRGRHIGYIFQTHHLLPGLTALENVLMGMSFTGRTHDRAWAHSLLNDVGLSDRLHYKPQKLSVGQQQRVAVARALANRPKLVLADEPTGALDVRNAQQVLELIRKLCKEVNASLLLVSHDLAIARQLDRVMSLSDVNKAAAANRPAEAALA